MSTRDTIMKRLGGPPGRYVVAAVVLAIFWFPVRLWLDDPRPLAATIALSGLYGTMWGLFPAISEWLYRRRHPDAGVELPEAERRAWLRRGAQVGLALGVPFFGGLLVLCLTTGRSWIYSLSFAVALLVVVAVAIKSPQRP